MASFDQTTYLPQEGDIYIKKVRVDRFTIHRYDGVRWEQLGGHYNEQDINGLVSVMQFLGKSTSKRRYYRPLLRYGVKER